MVAARTHATRWLTVGVILFALALSLALAAGCGTNDKWVGTWVKVDDSNTGLEIEKKNDTTYNVHDPDGSNAFDATLEGNTLSGTTTTDAGGKPITVDVTLTIGDSGDTMKFSMMTAGLDQPMTWDLKKK
jgi:hypothetical protein